MNKYLGSDHFAHNLPPVGGHNSVKRIDNSLSRTESVVFGQSQKEIFGQLIHLQLVTGGSQAFSLQSSLDGRISQEVGQPLVLFQSCMERFEVFFYNFQGLFLRSGRKKCRSIATFSAKDLYWRLNKLMTGNGGWQASAQYPQMAAIYREWNTDFQCVV